MDLVLENQNGHDKDIRQYIHQRLLIDRNDLKRDLAESIRCRAYGVFLWVILVVALVNQDDRNGNAAGIYQRLDQIPTELSDLFNELIERGTKSYHLRPLLQWVAFSIPPLTPAELYCTLTNEASKIYLETPAFQQNNLAKFILSASKGLVETTNGPWPRVQFIHESLCALDLGLTQQTFIDHALPWNELSILQESDHSVIYLPWGEFANTEPWYKAYAAAKLACPKLLKAVLETQPRFKATSKQWGAILCASIEVSDDEGISIALQAGANPNAPSSGGSGQCLVQAVRHASRLRYWDRPHESRRWHIIELLLKYGAIPFATTAGTKDCLYQACRNNDMEIVRILLGEHLKADVQCSDYGVSLAHDVRQARHLGNDEMLRFLLNKGAETGWWSQATLNTTIDKGKFLEIKLSNMSILRSILEERLSFSPSTVARSRQIMEEASEDSTGVTMRFKLGTPRSGFQS